MNGVIYHSSRSCNFYPFFRYLMSFRYLMKGFNQVSFSMTYSLFSDNPGSDLSLEKTNFWPSHKRGIFFSGKYRELSQVITKLISIESGFMLYASQIESHFRLASHHGSFLKQKHTNIITKFPGENPSSKVILFHLQACIPRTTQWKLSQLRSGYSRLLNTYLAHLDNQVSLLSLLSTHTSCDIFNGPRNPSPFTPADVGGNSENP